MDDLDERSTDGSDNGSDLEDFLVGSEDEEMLKSDVDSEQDETAEATTLLDEFPYDKSLLQDRPVPERHKFLFHIFTYRRDQFDALIQQFS